ncbi:MAG: protein-L-isoaspartate O-methyltransferase, partial [Anaerolineales bacterium]
QPYIVALMTDLLRLHGDETVLEIGTGSGYQAAVLAALAKHIYTVERHPELAHRAALTLHALDINNVTVLEGDGSTGWPEFAPYDAVLVTAAAPKAPQPLLDQLALGGRLVLPVGEIGKQYLEVWRHDEEGYRSEIVVPVSFVPLVGEYGFEENDN